MIELRVVRSLLEGIDFESCEEVFEVIELRAVRSLLVELRGIR